VLRILHSAALAFSLTLFTSSASAAEPEPSRWYGGQTLATDGAAAALFVTAIFTNGSSTALGLSAATYLIGAPIVHLANGEGGRAGGSFMLRVTAPLLGAVIVSEAMRSEPQSCSYYGHSTDCNEDRQMQSFFGALIGGTLGAVAASVTDAAAIAWKPAARPPVTIAPQVGAERFAVSVIGTF
jgi:hypothetical protein